MKSLCHDIVMSYNGKSRDGVTSFVSWDNYTKGYKVVFEFGSSSIPVRLDASLSKKDAHYFEQTKEGVDKVFDECFIYMISLKEHFSK